MIFPGMDPYLEHPILWTGVHASLIVYIRDQLQPQLRPRYVAAIEERVYLSGMEHDRAPDIWIERGRHVRAKRTGAVRNGAAALLEADAPVVVQVADEEVHETYVTILDLQARQQLVTVIEVVSPTNKYADPGREGYVAKQQQIRRSTAHLVEIDLLRFGPHVLAVAEPVARSHGPYHYLACVNRAKGHLHETYDLYPRTLAQRLPRIAIPLAGDDPDVVLDIQAALEQTYERGAYEDRLDYGEPCVPPLTKDDEKWVDQILIDCKLKTAPRPRRSPKKH